MLVLPVPPLTDMINARGVVPDVPAEAYVLVEGFHDVIFTLSIFSSPEFFNPKAAVPSDIIFSQFVSLELITILAPFAITRLAFRTQTLLDSSLRTLGLFITAFTSLR